VRRSVGFKKKRVFSAFWGGVVTDAIAACKRASQPPEHLQTTRKLTSGMEPPNFWWRTAGAGLKPLAAARPSGPISGRAHCALKRSVQSRSCNCALRRSERGRQTHSDTEPEGCVARQAREWTHKWGGNHTSHTRQEEPIYMCSWEGAEAMCYTCGQVRRARAKQRANTPKADAWGTHGRLFLNFQS